MPIGAEPAAPPGLDWLGEIIDRAKALHGAHDHPIAAFRVTMDLLSANFKLEDAQRLAIAQGFVFEGSDENTPLPRRAKLSGKGPCRAVSRRRFCCKTNCSCIKHSIKIMSGFMQHFWRRKG